jgi:pilus assembly protein CpaC
MTPIIQSQRMPGQSAASIREEKAGSIRAFAAAIPRRWLLLAMILLLAETMLVLPALAARGEGPEKLYVALRKSLLLDLGEQVETVSITDTDLADFVVAAKTQVLIHGKKEGITSLVVWVKGGKHKSYDLIVQRGFAPKQVLLKVRVAEVTNTDLTEYGIDYVARMLESDADRAVGVFSGDVGTPAIPHSAGTLPEYSDGADVVLRWWKGDERYAAVIHALQQKGLLKVIARPDLICIDGEQASFLSGGEFPVPIAQSSSGGGTTVTIEWKEYGTQLDFRPTVVDSDLVRLEVEPLVSALDFNTAVVLGGFVVPGLTTRRASTEVELHEGESLIIGGLKSSAERKIERKIPIIGDIPLLGYLFRSQRKEIEESELMILVTPSIIEPLAANEVPLLPGEAPPPVSGQPAGD